MKIIILAAGKGSRLGEPRTPKPLTLLENGKSILEMQLETISPLLSLHQVLIVVGYKKEKIMEKFPHLLFVYNPDYSQENTSKSLLKALYKVEDDLLWMNGDVLLHPSILKDFIHFDHTAMVVNEGPVAEEEVKYQTDSHHRITEVSKKVKKAKGEALGINLFKKKDLPSLREGLEGCAANDYFEKGIEWAIHQGVHVKSFPVAEGLCTEIDFPEDLERANKLLKSW